MFYQFKVWINGPALNYPRTAQSCAKIRKDKNDPSLSVIVVGGYNNAYLNSVEILDEKSSMWRIGPYLPAGGMAFGIVEDPRGGVILVGGFIGSGRINSLYRLKHGGLNSKWELMTQKLKVANHFAAAFIIPDTLAQNCSIF